ncbi:MAG: hypothetical protein ACOZHQ_01360 [Thermodesulfobacteriota bacterium]
MAKVLLISRDPAGLTGLATALAGHPQAEVAWAHDPQEAVAATRRWRPHLAVLDDSLGENQPWALIRDLLAVDAFLNTAVVSGLDPEAFHEAGEGLGVLAQLPPAPGPAEAAWLLYHLREVMVSPPASADNAS